MKIYRVKYGWSFFHIRNPFTMWQFLRNAEARAWCDRLYNLIKSSPLA